MEINFDKKRKNTKKREGDIQLFKYKDIVIKKVTKNINDIETSMFYLYLDKRLFFKHYSESKIKQIFNLLASKY